MMLDKNVLFVGIVGVVTSLQVPPEIATLIMGSLITGLIAYIAQQISKGQDSRKNIEKEVITLSTQMEGIEDRFDRLEDTIDRMWMNRHQKDQ